MSLLRNSWDKESGAFSYDSAAKGGGTHGSVIPCLTGNMAWSLIRLGYVNAPQTRAAIQWLARYQRFDDGIVQTPRGWPYDGFEMCWGRHSCFMGVVKTLKALSAIPAKARSKTVNQTIHRGAEFILAHHIHKRSHALDHMSRPGWLKLGFPHMYQTDILEILLLLTGLGYRDPRMREAVAIVRSKRREDGRWQLEQTFNDRFQKKIERKGEPSKWITARAMNMLKHCGD